MKLIRKLPSIEELNIRFPVTERERNKRQLRLGEIQGILSGKSSKKLLVVGPCSADREDAVLEYVRRLSRLQEAVSDVFVLIPRVYSGKPRTTGGGYKGMIHRLDASNEQDDLVEGIIAVRELHWKVIKETGMFAADELLYSGLYSYMADLLVYMSVGARSVEDQEHRLAASGLDIPVGMKNPTSGNLEFMLNAVMAAQTSHRIIVGEWEAQTEGNEYAHSILRGYTNTAGENVPNYYYEQLQKMRELYDKSNLKNPGIIVDCNHANSNKQYMEQCRIAEDVFSSCRRNHDINNLTKGLMIESYLEDGCQRMDEGIYGKSITDSCLGWDKTKRLILELGDKI